MDRLRDRIRGMRRPAFLGGSRQPGEPGEQRPVRVITSLSIVVLVVFLAILITQVFGGGADTLAQLRLRRSVVEVKSGDDVFTVASEGQGLSQGDIVRTDPTGQAQIDWADGSFTVIDSETTLAITELTVGPNRVELDVEAGRIWNRVERLSGSQDRYRVTTGTAVATVRGTIFVVDCRVGPECAVYTVEGEVDATGENGETITMGDGDCVVFTAEGGVEPCDEQTRQLIQDEWFQENLAEEGELPTFTPTPTDPPTPSATLAPTPVPTPVPTPTPTASPTATPTPKPTASPTSTPTASPSSPPPTSTPTSTPTDSPEL